MCKVCGGAKAGARAAPGQRPFLGSLFRVAVARSRALRVAPSSRVCAQKKLEGGHYADLEAFATDMRLIWANCYTYNKDPNSDVCIMARELENLTEARLARIPDEIEERRGEIKEKQTDDVKAMQKQFKMQQKQLMMMQQQLIAQQVCRHLHSHRSRGDCRIGRLGAKRGPCRAHCGPASRCLALPSFPSLARVSV